MSRPSLCAILIVLLMTAAVPIGSTAQSAESADTDLVIEDPAGDVRTSAFIARAPVGAPLDHIDIRSLRIGAETPRTFAITMHLAGWDETVSAPAEQGSVSGMSCGLSWNYGEGLDYRYALYIYTNGQGADGRPTFTGRLSFWSWEENQHNSDYTAQGQTVAYDPETHTLTATIDKSFVPSFPGPEEVRKGDAMENIYAWCATDTGLLVYHYDDTDLDGKTYPFVEEGAGSVVRVGFGTRSGAGGALHDWQFPEGSTDGTRTSIAPGQQSLVPVRLENLVDQKRLVMLSANLLGDASGWNTTIAPSIFLKAGETRTVHLIVTPPAGAAFGTSVEVEVEAEVAGGEGSGVASERLVVAPQLSAENNVIRFHSEPVRGSALFNALMTVLPAHTLRLSLLETEDGYSDEPFGPGPVFGHWSSARLDALGNTVRLAEEPADLRLEVTGDPGAALDVTFNFGDPDLGLFYSHRGTYESGVHEISLVAHHDGPVDLPVGTSLYGEIQLSQENALLAARVDPKGTTLTLPIRDVEAGLNVTDGRFLPNLALGEDEDRVTYLNPGKEYAFDLVLSNDGIEEDDLQVAAKPQNATGWTVDLLPGARFRVPAGESTPVTIDVIAPADAKEGDTLVVEIQATSKNDPLAQASITLRAVVTTNLEIEEKRYAEKEDQLAPLADEEEGAPAPLALLAILAAVGLIRRRRT